MLVLLFILYVGIAVIGARIQNGLVRKASCELTDILSRWDKAGRPQDGALLEFMTNAYVGVIASNACFSVAGTNYYGQFATTRLGFPGILFITTNRAVILIRESGEPELVAGPENMTVHRQIK